MNGHHCYVENNVLYCRAIVSIDHSEEQDELTENILRELNLPTRRKKRVNIRVPLNAIECWYEEVKGQTVLGLVSGLAYRLDVDINAVDSVIIY